MHTLPVAEWTARRAAHERRVDVWLEPHLARRREGVPHPVEDFLFTYYQQRPAALRRWHPGFGVALEDAPEYAALRGYAHPDGRGADLPPGGREADPSPGGRGAEPLGEASRDLDAPCLETPGRRLPDSSTTRSGSSTTRSDSSTTRGDSSTTRGGSSTTRDAPVVTVGAAYVDSQRPLLESLHRLLAATAARPAQLGCFGLHEWAMVYRRPQDAVRHAAWPLRLGPEGTDEVVESHRIGCSHFDAFRFFTEEARPRNALQPRADDRAELEQPGCLHAGMDLYKHAYRLTPMIASELVADCFELARDIRVLDMRASPYDLVALGHAPVRIETPAGKREYVEAQRGFAERGAPLRRRLVEQCERLLAAATPVGAGRAPATGT